MDMTRREDYLGCRVSEISRRDRDGDTHSQRLRFYYSRNKSTESNYYPAPTFEELVGLTFKEAQEILLSKHHDYGPTNIANAPGGSLNGLRVRIHDKTARINHLIDNAKYKNPQHESLRDSFLDLMNYAAIALLVIDGHWPTGNEPADDEADCG